MSVAIATFVRTLSFDAMPADVVRQGKRCLLDLIGVAAGGSRMPAATIANGYAAAQMTSRDTGARLLFDGRHASCAGAAFAGASTIDSLDAHDGHVLTKGHAGVAVLPALLAAIDGGAECSAAEFLTCLVLGYEIGTRAGIALHESVSDYHCSGAWSALACAAIVGRLLRLDDAKLREALGIAEYIAPRGQILRVCAHPTMLKDGSSWGAHSGVTAALLARDGFTGAPAVTVEDDGIRSLWSDLGTRWRIREQYFKAYPVCRWAQPAIEAALVLQRDHGFVADDIARISIETFCEAVTLGSGRAVPQTTEDAQYSLPYPVAAALVFGRLGADEIDRPALLDARVRRLLGVMMLIDDHEFSCRFPAERWARVEIALKNGRTLRSEPAEARGDPENPISEEELREKFFALAVPVLGRARAERIEQLGNALPDDGSLSALLDELLRATA
ncbi:MAG TPA: MmgE/PrpD family protein [Casimicrobiaceae bacterium]|jgi:2-methylcitrate dehydratase PrpD